jgi:hypothetical protein
LVPVINWFVVNLLLFQPFPYGTSIKVQDLHKMNGSSWSWDIWLKLYGEDARIKSKNKHFNQSCSQKFIYLHILKTVLKNYTAEVKAVNIKCLIFLLKIKALSSSKCFLFMCLKTHYFTYQYNLKRYWKDTEMVKAVHIKILICLQKSRL